MLSVVHDGMARKLSTIFSHCAHLYCAACVIVAFAMIFSARKREKDGACQIFVQGKGYGRRIKGLSNEAAQEFVVFHLPSAWAHPRYRLPLSNSDDDTLTSRPQQR